MVVFKDEQISELFLLQEFRIHALSVLVQSIRWFLCSGMFASLRFYHQKTKSFFNRGSLKSKGNYGIPILFFNTSKFSLKIWY